MNTLDSRLDPQRFRAKITGAKAAGSEAGAMMIEMMIYFAIVAIVATAVLPQMNKYLEKAEVNNMIEVANSAKTEVEAQYSLTGSLNYPKSLFTTIGDDVRTNSKITIKGGLLAADGGALSTAASSPNYWLTVISTDAPNYCVVWKSAGMKSNADGNKVTMQVIKKAGAAAACAVPTDVPAP